MSKKHNKQKAKTIARCKDIRNKFAESRVILSSYELDILKILTMGQLNIIWGHVKNATHVRAALERAWAKLRIPAVSAEGVYMGQVVPQRRKKLVIPKLSYAIATNKLKQQGYTDFRIGSEACQLRDEMASELREQWGGERSGTPYEETKYEISTPQETAPTATALRKAKSKARYEENVEAKRLKREDKLLAEEGEPVDKWYNQGANVHAPFNKYIR